VKLKYLGAVVATIMSVFDIPVGFSPGDIATGWAWAISALGVIGLVAVLGLLRQARWGPPAVVAIGVANLVGAVIALARDENGAVVGLVLSVAIGACVLPLVLNGRSGARALAAVSVLLVLFGAGCGDDDSSAAASSSDSSSAAAGTLTAAEFRDQAEAICTQANQEIDAAVGQVFGAETDPTPDQLQEALDTIIAVSRRQLDDIGSLAEPSDMTADVEALVAEGRSATDAAEAQGLGFFENDDDPWAHTAELAAGLGLDACSGE
jgi:hypothetical protein